MSTIERSSHDTPPGRVPQSDLYELVVQHSPYCIHRIDLEGRLAAMNPAGLAMLGVEDEGEIRGVPYISSVAEQDEARVQALLDAALAGQSSEFEFTSVNGRSFLASFVPMFDATGELISLMGITQDITARVEARERLERSEERLKLALFAAGMGVWEVDLETQCVLLSDRAYAIYGVDRESFGESFISYLRLVHPQDKDEVRAAVALAATRPERIHTEHRIIRPSDGEVRWIQGVGRSLADDSGEVKRVMGTVMDVTERVKLEDQLREMQKLESLGILAGGIAHDFNNLLAGVLGHAEGALHSVDPGSEAAGELDRLIQIAEQAAQLCGQMLAYSGRGGFVVESLNLSRAVEDISALLLSSIPKTVTLRRRLEADLPAVRADVTQLHQVIMNLITNAAESVEEEHGTVTVRTGFAHFEADYLAGMRVGSELEAGEYVFLEVADDGGGMDPATLATLFDPFVSSKAAGRGLGLAAVLGIVHGHHGGIHVASEPGSGAVFTVLLPPSEPAVEAPATEAAAVTPQTDLTSTVLVVDDEEYVRHIATRLLERDGFDVLAVASGEEAIVQVEQRGESIHAVLLDMTMPGMNGGETLVELRKVVPSLPVILTSGYSQQDAAALLELERVVFLQKPYRHQELLSALERLLGGEAVAT